MENFPNLWFIEDNASYRGFIADYKNPDKHNAGFYNYYVKGAGNLGADFYNYKEGLPKLGDTPTLLYMMDGDPADPSRESWGGSFEKIKYSSRCVFDRPTTANDTIQRDGIIEWHFKGPILKAGEGKVANSPWSSGADNEVGVLTVDNQKWPVYYLGKGTDGVHTYGKYMCRYCTYKCGVRQYTIESEIKDFPAQKGEFFVENIYPGKHRDTDYTLGDTWWGDRLDKTLYLMPFNSKASSGQTVGSWLDEMKSASQGGITVQKWRNDVMDDWGKRCGWLK